MILDGRVWKVGNDVGATDLVPARYDKAGMQWDWPECARHLLEDYNPRVANEVLAGDIIIGGHNLGAGHMHYYMAAIKGSEAAGIGALLADSVNALFFRTAVDAGVTAWSFNGVSAFVDTGDHLRIDLPTGSAQNLTAGTTTTFAPVSPIVLEILAAGGSKPWALARVTATPG